MNLRKKTGCQSNDILDATICKVGCVMFKDLCAQDFHKLESHFNLFLICHAIIISFVHPIWEKQDSQRVESATVSLHSPFPILFHPWLLVWNLPRERGRYIRRLASETWQEWSRYPVDEKRKPIIPLLIFIWNFSTLSVESG